MRRPTRLLGLALAVVALPPGRRAAAQTGPQTNLVLTLAAGVVNGDNLWVIQRQPFCPVFSGGSCAPGYDTLRLAREMASSPRSGSRSAISRDPRSDSRARSPTSGCPCTTPALC